MELLDAPIWNALSGEQRALALANDDAARFPRTLTSLAGVRETTPAGFEALARLLPPGERTGLFLPVGLLPTAPLEVLDGAPLTQMISDREVDAPADPRIVELGPDDAPAMLALAKLARPGPFDARTHELGTFLGVREGGRLVAMAGQRLRLPGMVEVSAVATDPAFTGRGLGAALMTAQCTRIRAAGRTPFLHVRATNDRAIALYERLGFVVRRQLHYHVVRAAR